MNHFRRFQQGDKVTYTGSKFAKELQGSLGIVDGFIQGSEHGVVVSFGSDSFVMDETRHLTTFQGKIKSEAGDKEERKGPDVQKRKGLKRRVVDQDDSE